MKGNIKFWLQNNAELKNHDYSPTNMKNPRIEEFRQVAYKYLGRAKHATFELTDTILLACHVYYPSLN